MGGRVKYGYVVKLNGKLYILCISVLLEFFFDNVHVLVV